MADLRRVLDKFQGRKFCDLLPEEQAEYMGAVAQRAAGNALRALGLDDENAIRDMKDLRDLLQGLRVMRAFRHTAWKASLTGAAKLLGYITLLWLASIFLHNPTVQKLADRIVP